MVKRQDDFFRRALINMSISFLNDRVESMLDVLLVNSNSSDFRGWRSFLMLICGDWMPDLSLSLVPW